MADPNLLSGSWTFFLSFSHDQGGIGSEWGEGWLPYHVPPPPFAAATVKLSVSYLQFSRKRQVSCFYFGLVVLFNKLESTSKS